MLKYILILVFVFWFNPVSAEPNSTIDSLVSLLGRTPKNEQYVSILNQLAFQYRESDHIRTLEYANAAKDLAQKIKFERGMGEALNHIAWVYFRRNNLVLAFDLTTQAYDLGIKIKDTTLQINCINTIAGIYRFQKKYASANEILRKALHLSESSKNYSLLLRSLANLCQILLESNQLDSATHYVKKAMSIVPKVKNSYYVIGTYRNLADIAFAKKEYDTAIYHYKECINIAKEKKLHYSHIASMRRMAQAYIYKKDDKTASVLLEKTIEIGEAYKLLEDLSIAYRLLAEINARQKDFTKAYKYELRYAQLSDSLSESRLNDKMTLVEKEHELERRNDQLGSLGKENELKQAKIKEQQFIIFSVILLGVFLAILIVILFNNQKNNKRAYAIMTRQRDEITEKNKTNEEQSQKLEKANLLKDKLFAIIGHDLRTPVASLKNIFDLLENQMLTQEEFYFLSMKLRKSVDGVYSTLNNLLLWAQVQMQGVKSMPLVLDICQEVENKLLIFQPIAAQKHIILENKILHPILVFIDENQLASILRNLLNNAIKFTPEGGKIEIDAYEYPDNDSFMQVSVSDTGIGIAADKLSILFQNTVVASTRGTEGEVGTGLGLLLCQEFVENNGGKIWAKSTVGEGTTFNFTIPKEKLT